MNNSIKRERSIQKQIKWFSKSKGPMFGTSKSLVMHAITTQRPLIKTYSSEHFTDSYLSSNENPHCSSKLVKKRRGISRSTKFNGLKNKNDKRIAKDLTYSSPYTNIHQDYFNILKTRDLKVKKRSCGINSKTKIKHLSTSTIKTAIKSKSVSTTKFKPKRSLHHTKSVGTHDKKYGKYIQLGTSKNSLVTFEEKHRVNINKLLLAAMEILNKDLQQQTCSDEQSTPKDTSTTKSIVSSGMLNDIKNKQNEVNRIMPHLRDMISKYDKRTKMRVGLNSSQSPVKSTTTTTSSCTFGYLSKSNAKMFMKPVLKLHKTGLESEILEADNFGTKLEPNYVNEKKMIDRSRISNNASIEFGKKYKYHIENEDGNSDFFQINSDQTLLVSSNNSNSASTSPRIKKHANYYLKHAKPINDRFDAIKLNKNINVFGTQNASEHKNADEMKSDIKQSYKANIELKITNKTEGDLKEEQYFKRDIVKHNSKNSYETNTSSADDKKQRKKLETITLYSKNNLVQPLSGINVSQKSNDLKSEISSKYEKKENHKSSFRSQSPKKYTRVRWQSETKSSVRCLVGKGKESSEAKNLINGVFRSNKPHDQTCSKVSKKGRLEILKDFDFGIKLSNYSFKRNHSFISLGSKMSRAVRELGLKSWHYLSKHTHNDENNQYGIGSRESPGLHHNAVIEAEAFREELLCQVKKTLKDIADGNITKSIMELMIDKNTGRMLKTEDIIRRIVSSRSQAIASKICVQPCQPVKDVANPTQKKTSRAFLSQPRPPKQQKNKMKIPTKLPPPKSTGVLGKGLIKIHKAMKQSEIAPSYLKMLKSLDKNNGKYDKLPWNKYDIMAKLRTEEGHAEILREICKAIKTGRVSPSLIELAISKKLERDSVQHKQEPFRTTQSKKLESKRFYKKPMNEKGIIIRFDTNVGQNKISRTVRKAKKIDKIPPSHIEQKKDRRNEAIHKFDQKKIKSGQFYKSPIQMQNIEYTSSSSDSERSLSDYYRRGSLKRSRTNSSSEEELRDILSSRSSSSSSTSTIITGLSDVKVKFIVVKANSKKRSSISISKKAKNADAKKVAAKNADANNVAAKNVAAKNVAAKKVATKKVATKNVATKNVAAKNLAAKNVAAKNTDQAKRESIFKKSESIPFIKSEVELKNVLPTASSASVVKKTNTKDEKRSPHSDLQKAKAKTKRKELATGLKIIKSTDSAEYGTILKKIRRKLAQKSEEEIKNILLTARYNRSTSRKAKRRGNCAKRPSRSVLKKVKSIDHSRHQSILKKLKSIPFLKSEVELKNILPTRSHSGTSHRMMKKTKSLHGKAKTNGNASNRTSRPVLKKVTSIDQTRHQSLLKKFRSIPLVKSEVELKNVLPTRSNSRGTIKATKKSSKQHPSRNVLKKVKSIDHERHESILEKLRSIPFLKSEKEIKNILPTACSYVKAKKKYKQHPSRTALKKVNSIDHVRHESFLKKLRSIPFLKSEKEIKNILPTGSNYSHVKGKKSFKQHQSRPVLKKVKSIDHERHESILEKLRSIPFLKSEKEIKNILPSGSHCACVKAMKKHHMTPYDLENNNHKPIKTKKLDESKSAVVHLKKNEIVNKLGSEGGEAEIVYAIRKAIRRGDISPSLLDIVINNEVHQALNENRILDYIGSRNNVTPMCKRKIFFNLSTDEGVDKITKRIADAIKLGKVSPYLIEIMLNKDKEIKFLKKKEANKLPEPITKDQIIRKLCSKDAIRRGLVPPSVIQNIINKDPPEQPFKQKSTKKGEVLDKYEVLNRLGSKNGESKILKQICRGLHLNLKARNKRKLKNKSSLANFSEQCEKTMSTGQINPSFARLLRGKNERKINEALENMHLRDMETVRKKICKDPGLKDPPVRNRAFYKLAVYTANIPTYFLVFELSAIKKGCISPAILYDVLYHIKPLDSKSQVIEKVLNGKEKLLHNRL
ncbi:hypothetical protein HF086_014402 [Spodoptera exigua]|uniref:Uncharacterized protein n=1 Tax=Spodoptera exigua TaxID=7107 RepID=A0A922SQ48_SPOEX|nr:hypothetical protein HF086_014402 [Spodoptera exigua]